MSNTFRRRDFLKASAAAGVLAAIEWPLRVAAADSKLKIGVIGAGNVGSALGRVWAQADGS